MEIAEGQDARSLTERELRSTKSFQFAAVPEQEGALSTPPPVAPLGGVQATGREGGCLI